MPLLFKSIEQRPPANRNPEIMVNISKLNYTLFKESPVSYKMQARFIVVCDPGFGHFCVKFVTIAVENNQFWSATTNSSVNDLVNNVLPWVSRQTGS